MPAFAGETRMDLLLWRHAEAEEGELDFDRALTARGEKQAKAMAKWIRQHQPKPLRIIASPTVRTQQTVAALELPFETNRKIGPDACVSELIAATGWPATLRTPSGVNAKAAGPALGFQTWWASVSQ